jgi:CPA2 family monovalent cation:H+ antiporter-2
MSKSVVFVLLVLGARLIIARSIVPKLAEYKSVELVILFTLSLLGGVCWGAHALGLPPAIGALATGIALSGNRLSRQIDSVMLPFRETFAAVFFVTLGTLLHPAAFLREPLLLLGGLAAVLLFKSAAAAVALKVVGLRWPAAIAMGLGLAQLGEFSFLVLAEGVSNGLVSPENYHRVLFVALGTLILTPQLLKFALRWIEASQEDQHFGEAAALHEGHITHAVVIGAGLAGRRIASHLETIGLDLCVVDQNPINLHPFAQQGIPTINGDACDPATLRRANADECSIAVVTIPYDDGAKQVVRELRRLSPNATILARCRYTQNVSKLRKAGANAVVSDEAETVNGLLQAYERLRSKSNKRK